MVYIFIKIIYIAMLFNSYKILAKGKKTKNTKKNFTDNKQNKKKNIGNSCDCCQCSANKNFVKNNLLNLDGTIRIEKVKTSKNNLIKEVGEINKIFNNCMNKMIKETEGITITNENKVICYINFINLIYIVNLIKCFSIKHKHGYDKKITEFLNFCDIKLAQPYANYVKKGKEINVHKIIIDIRKKCIRIFEEDLQLKDCLTGFHNIKNKTKL